MKKFLTKLSSLAALFVAGAAFTACSSDTDITGEDNNGGSSALVGKTYDLKLGVSKNDELTRSLQGGETDLTALWTPSDRIYVYDGSWNLYGGSLQPTESKQKQCPVTGKISLTDAAKDEIKVHSKLNFAFPRTTWDYTGQDGTLATLAKKYDYAIGETAEVTEMKGTEITDTDPGEVEFESQQAIVRFDFKDTKGADLKVKALEIYDNNRNITKSVSAFNNGTETKSNMLNLTFASSGLSKAFVALRGVQEGDELTLTATAVDGTLYTRVVKINTTGLSDSEAAGNGLMNGKFYVITFAPEVIEDEALTVEAITDGTNVALDFTKCQKDVTVKILNPDNTLAGITIVSHVIPGGILLNKGQKALFYGENDTYTTYTGEPGTQDEYVYEYDSNGNIINVSYQGPTLNVGNCSIMPSDECYLYNNIMSLTNGFDWKSKANTDAGKTLRAKGTFAGLFKEARVKEHPTKPLVLPATNLQQGCYQQLLYKTHFSKVPADLLPATTLQYYCYASMFYGTPLEKSPELPATKLVKGCYNYMFSSCGSLNEITCSAKDIEGNTDPDDESDFNTCTANWTQGVAETGTFHLVEGTPENITVANYFATNSTVTEYNGFKKDEYMGKPSPKVPFAIGTGGIPQHWTVTE